MRIARAATTGMFAVLALALAACWPVSINPIKGTATTTADPRIAGGWSGRFGDPDEGDETTFIHFLVKDDGGFTALTLKHGDKEDSGWAAYTITTSEVAKTNYMNVRVVSSDGKIEDTNFSRFFTFARYEVSDTTLDIFVIDEDKLIAAIDAGKLKGEVERREFTKDVKITAESAEIDAFLAASDPKSLFSEHLVHVTRLPSNR